MKKRVADIVADVLFENGITDVFDAEVFEKKLANILSKIEGAGDVEVMISYQTGIETIPLLDTKDSNTVTEESDNDSARRTEQNSLETSIIFNQEKNGNKMPYISITPTFSICPEHGYINGEHFDCPTCGHDTEVWSRVVGFIRPVNNFHVGKRQEYGDRKKYVIKEEQLEDLTDCEVAETIH